MKLSVVMSVRNCAPTVARAVESVLLQTLPPNEVIVIDDGSTDSTPEILSRYPIRLLHGKECVGQGTRLNQAVANARGELIARMDGDDLSHPDRFEKQVAYLDSHPEVDLVGSSILLMNAPGRKIGEHLYPETHEQICYLPWCRFRLPHPTWMGRAGWFRRNPYWSRKSEDFELLLRTYRTSRFANVTEPLLTYRDVFSLQKALSYRAATRAALRKHGQLKGIPLSLGLTFQDCFFSALGLKYLLE